MNIILIACIILFITYASIIGILLYHFIWKRDIWDKTFYPIWDWDMEMQMETETETSSSILKSLFRLSNEREHEHQSEQHKQKDNTDDIYQIGVLGEVYTLLTSLEELPGLGKMFQILKYIIRNYNVCKDAKIELLDALLGISIGGGNQIGYVKGIEEQVLDNELELELEDILIIETNLETIKKLMNVLLKLDINKMSSSFLLAFMIRLQKNIMVVLKYVF